MSSTVSPWVFLHVIDCPLLYKKYFVLCMILTSARHNMSSTITFAPQEPLALHPHSDAYIPTEALCMADKQQETQGARAAREEKPKQDPQPKPKHATDPESKPAGKPRQQPGPNAKQAAQPEAKPAAKRLQEPKLKGWIYLRSKGPESPTYHGAYTMVVQCHEQ